VLRENNLAVERDVEYPAAARDQINIGAQLGFDCVRQSGGLRFVVSLGAVGDADIHLGSFSSFPIWHIYLCR